MIGQFSSVQFSSVKFRNQNTPEVKHERFMFGLDKSMCKFSANFAFDKATYERTNGYKTRDVVKTYRMMMAWYMEDETNTKKVQSGGYKKIENRDMTASVQGNK